MHPRHLGVATVTGTRTKIKDLTPGENAKPDQVRSLNISALSTNLGTVYIGDDTLDAATLAGVVAILAPGGEFSVGGGNFGPITWKSFSAIAGTPGDKLLITGIEG